MPCVRSGSETIERMVLAAFSEEYGSWKIGWMRRASSRRVKPETASPSIRISPPVGRSRPSSILANVVLPQPLSPTSPSTEPRSSFSDRPFTACSGFFARIRPCETWNTHSTFRVSSTGTS